MNYKLHYEKLIKRAVQRGKIDEFTESHHILPRCMGGTDDADNLVDLLPREHYIAHLLLVKIYPDVSGLWFAAHMMASTKNKNQRMTNRHYDWVRNQFIKRISSAVKDSSARKYGFKSYLDQVEHIWQIYVDERISANRISAKLKIPSANICRSLNVYLLMNPSYIDLYEEIRYEIKSNNSKHTRANISKESEERRINATRMFDYSKRDAKLSSERMGVNNPNFGNRTPKQILTCPHCEFTGGSGSIHRWHFDNCKRLKINED